MFNLGRCHDPADFIRPQSIPHCPAQESASMLNQAPSDTSEPQPGWYGWRDARINDIAVLLLCGLSFGLSGIESWVNVDMLHWGLMYGQAIDVYHGLMPYGETPLIYGWLTSWIQAGFIGLLGEKFTAIGIATGLFYAVSLWLSYQIFQRFLTKYFASFAVFYIFLIHPYCTYAWSNYYSYTFVLAAILMLANGYRSGRRSLLAGVLIGLSLLCRYSSVVGIIPAFALYFGYELLDQRADQRTVWMGGRLFSIGLLLPILSFMGWLFSQGVLADFVCENQAVIEAWTPKLEWYRIPGQLLAFLFAPELPQGRDSRINFFTVNFIGVCGTLVYLIQARLRQSADTTRSVNQAESQVILAGLVSLCGYLNSIHLYEVFRLINATSLGFGVMAYGIDQLIQRSARGQLSHAKILQVAILIPMVAICFVWGNRLILQSNTSVYNPWKLATLTGQGETLNEIKIFRGKRFSPAVAQFYRDIATTLAPYDDRYTMVNGTNDPALVLIKPLPRAQKLVIPISAKFHSCCGDTAKIQRTISSGQAILFSFNDLQQPSYQVVFRQPWPIDVPMLGGWQGQKLNNTLYIAVPQKPA
jgi:Dolichyl-phosphate-mannose-protein mannosyltransferase